MKSKTQVVRTKSALKSFKGVEVPKEVLKSIERKCSHSECDRKVHAHGLCYKHYKRVWKYGSDIVLQKGRTSVKGMHTPYINSYLLKKNRKIKLRQEPICQYCKEKASNLIHHINEDKSDHRLENLMSLCGNRCHAHVHIIIKQFKTMSRIEIPESGVYSEQEIEQMMILDQNRVPTLKVEKLF